MKHEDVKCENLNCEILDCNNRQPRVCQYFRDLDLDFTRSVVIDVIKLF